MILKNSSGHHLLWLTQTAILKIIETPGQHIHDGYDTPTFLLLPFLGRGNWQKLLPTMSELF